MKQKIKMKKFYILIALALIAITTILCGAVLAGTSSTAPPGVKLNIPNGENVKLIPNKNGGYFYIQNYNKQTHLALLDSRGNLLQEQTLDEAYQSTAISNDRLFILLNSSTTPGSKMIVVDLNTTSLANYNTADLDISLKNFTVSQNGTIYGINYNDIYSLYAYNNINYNNLSTAITLQTFDSPVRSLCTTPSDQMYIELNGSDFYYYTNVSQGLPYQFHSQLCDIFPLLPNQTLTDEIMIDLNGDLYRMNYHASLLFTMILDTSCQINCLSQSGTILGTSFEGDYIEEISTDGEILNRYTVDGQCIALATNQNNTGIIITKNKETYFVTLNEITDSNNSSSSEPESSQSQGSIPDEDNNNEGNISKPDIPTSSDTTYPNQLESDKYAIDRSNNTIMVPPSTTFANLRDSLNSTKDTIIMKNLSNTNVSSGNLGTGYTVSLVINGTTVDKLTIIVKGDVNGTGTVNSKDVLLLYNYLNESEQLSQIQLLAGDLNQDGIVDTSDLLLLKQQIATSV